MCSNTTQLLSKRHEYTVSVREVAVNEWEAKELTLIKWAKHRFMPKFKRLHELLLKKLDLLLSVRMLHSPPEKKYFLISAL